MPPPLAHRHAVGIVTDGKIYGYGEYVVGPAAGGDPQRLRIVISVPDAREVARLCGCVFVDCQVTQRVQGGR